MHVELLSGPSNLLEKKQRKHIFLFVVRVVVPKFSGTDIPSCVTQSIPLLVPSNRPPPKVFGVKAIDRVNERRLAPHSFWMTYGDGGGLYTSHLSSLLIMTEQSRWISLVPRLKSKSTC
jgi:hypothetical protein